jgi:hypothetical protein
LKIRKSDSHAVIIPDFIPVIVLKLKVKKAVVFRMPKIIYFNLPINGNGRVLIEIYTIASRRFKNKVKVRINFKKLLRIIINI